MGGEIDHVLEGEYHCLAPRLAYDAAAPGHVGVTDFMPPEAPVYLYLIKPRCLQFLYTFFGRDVLSPNSERLSIHRPDNIHLIEVLEDVMFQIDQFATDHEMKKLLRGIVWHDRFSP